LSTIARIGGVGDGEEGVAQEGAEVREDRAGRCPGQRRCRVRACVQGL